MKDFPGEERYPQELFAKIIDTKPERPRKALVGEKEDPPQYRSVSIVDYPDSTEAITLSWHQAIKVFWPHLTGKLMRNYEFTEKAATGFLCTYENAFNPLLDELFNEIILTGHPRLYVVCDREGPCGGIARVASIIKPEEQEMRTLNGHVITAADVGLKIEVTDEPGAGGANHRYEITIPDLASNPSLSMESEVLTILFQQGTVTDNGLNGVTHEALLAVVIDRLRSFQKGPYACRENALALTHLEESLHWLQQRTLRRVRAGIEGKEGQA